MSSYENEESRWNLRHLRGVAELLQPVALRSESSMFLPVKPTSCIDQCLHIPGKADSAYSSFSGGSNFPEYPTPLCFSEHDSLMIQEQLPYMDSGYVRSIYNPSAMHFEFRQMYENKMVGKSSHHKLEDADPKRAYGSTPFHVMLCRPPSPQTMFPFHPPSPPARADSYETKQNVGESHSESCFEHSTQPEVCVQDSSNNRPFDSLAHCYDGYWLSRCEDESPVTESGDIWHPTNQCTAKKNNSAFDSKLSLSVQENFKSDSLAKSQKILCAENSVHGYKIPEALNSKSSPSLRTSHNAVNDIQENKQYFYACSVHKPPFAEAALPSSVAGSSLQEGQLHGALHPFRVDEPSGLDQEIYECSSGLKFTGNPLPNKTALRIIHGYEDKKCFLSCEEGNSRDVWQPLLKQRARMQKPPHGLNFAEALHKEMYGAVSAVSHYSHEAEDSVFQANGFRKAKQSDNNRSLNLLISPRQEEELKAVHFPKQQFSKKTESRFQSDTASEKINRKTTPLLYYLSGGKHSSFISHHNQAQEQDGFSMKSPSSNHPVSAEPVEIPRDHNNHISEIASKDEEVILGSPASSVDEKFKNDYREKLKIAQRKVLRETSFKRKDLQMSLPIRLKQKPPSRPSIQHLRSMSLSSTNEDCTLMPPSKPLKDVDEEEESKRPQTVRIGGRKRTTKEQKKISYSEPEKLNQLDDQRDQSVLWRQKNARSRSDEINEQDTRIVRGKALENQGQILSKAELKLIQHNALLWYMERKTGQRPSAAKNCPQQKLPLQPKTSKRFVESGTSNPSISKTLQNMDGLDQFPAPRRIPELPSLLSAPAPTTTITSRCGASSPVLEIANSTVQAAVSEGSCASKCASAKSRLHSGSSASSKGQGRSKSAPSPVQDFGTPTAGLALPAQEQEYYPMHPDCSVPEKEGSDLGDSREEVNATDNSSCAETALESPASFSKEKGNKHSHFEKEVGDKLQEFDAPGSTKWQHSEANDTVRQSENKTCDCTAPTENQECNSSSNPLTNLKALQSEHDHSFPAQSTDLPASQAKSLEDQRCEDLVTEITAKDKSLVDILMPHRVRKTVLDLMEGLFPVNISALDRTCRRKWRFQSVQENDQQAAGSSCGTRNSLGRRAEAETLHINPALRENREDWDDPESITSKKRELISSIQLRLQALWDERTLVQSEAQEHAARSKELESVVQGLCKPNEYERYMMFIGDLEKVVSLLLCLSSRLARVQNAMGAMDENTDAEEKQSLHERHKLLSRQREDAKDLKENLDRRERVVSGILSKYMDESQLEDYRHFIQEKTSLLVEQKDLEEQIQFLEEQLERLEKSLLP
ncbi:protein Shroom1 isoform X2 [Varanus komodoensis]|uniref:protein Shroom1 isoform X2 n=1 Tax=Varanus komodoensis TaxID=61221 RepID=UPI001CF7792E|nr:protein Shroom1 isoform X2 [Varanus komodoensis]